MKKITSIILAIVAIISLCLVTGCGEQSASFGMGVYAEYTEATAAQGDIPGSVESEITVAAVLLGKGNKIVSCKLDTISASPSYTSDGKYVVANDIMSKYELGDDYNMVAYGKAKYEWYQQADNFSKLVAGKTIEEVKALVATGGKGNDEVVNAGCTIIINDFVLAIEKAVKNAAASSASTKDTVQVGIVAVQGECRDATKEADGVNEIDVALSAAAVDKDGKVTAMVSDAVVITGKFGVAGDIKSSINEEIVTKKEQGDKYGMVAYGGAEKEWYEQAAAFDNICIGKTAAEIITLEVKGYGNADVQSAGCTIAISDMVKAAVKAATIA